MSYGLRVMGIMFQGHFIFPFLLLSFNLKNKNPRLRTGDPSKMKTPNLYIVI
jgi:hypothetical protein